MRWTRRRSKLVVDWQETKEGKSKGCNFGSRCQQGGKCEIFIEEHSRLLLLLHLVNIMREMLLARITPVVQERDLPDPKNSPGSGKNITKMLKYMYTLILHYSVQFKIRNYFSLSVICWRFGAFVRTGVGRAELDEDDEVGGDRVHELKKNIIVATILDVTIKRNPKTWTRSYKLNSSIEFDSTLELA